MGKVINTVLEINASSAEVSERIPYALNIGYINGNSITIQTSGNNRYTDPIFLKAGESLTMKAVTLTNVGRLAKINPTTQAVTQLLQGTSASQAASAVYENTYTAAEDIYLIVGWNVLNYPLELTKTYIKTTTTSKIDDINAINDVLDIEVESSQFTEDVNLEVVNGQYYQGYSKELCTLQNSANFKRSQPFFVKAGEALTIVTSSLATSVSLLCVQEGNKYRNIVSGTNSSQTFNYTAPLDGYYVVSWNKNKTISVTKSGTKTEASSERLDEIEESTSLIPSIADSVEVVNDAIFYHYEDDLTEDYVAGKYISTNGQVGTNSSFRYKEFEVSAGTLITFSSYTHSSCAPIAKKISSGAYEVLATAQGFQYETFSYTATENCVIALSCYGVSPAPKAVFERQNIATNTLQIENILADMSAINKWAKRPNYGTFFDKIAVIGDSLSSGTLDAVTGDDAHVAGGSFGCTWLTYLAKKWGSSIRMHYSRGGATCYSWLGSNDYGLGLMLKDGVVYDAYFIALGHNDTGSYTIGTTSDTPTDVTVDANNDVVAIEPAADTTFLGNYKKIVNEIRTKAPNALIFCMTTYDKGTTDGTIGGQNKYIQQLAEWYYAQGDHRVFFLNYAEKTDISRSSSGHFSTFGYAYVANVINECVNDVIEAYLNTNALKVWGNFLESYRTTKNEQTRSGSYLPHI